MHSLSFHVLIRAEDLLEAQQTHPNDHNPFCCLFYRRLGMTSGGLWSGFWNSCDTVRANGSVPDLFFLETLRVICVGDVSLSLSSIRKHPTASLDRPWRRCFDQEILSLLPWADLLLESEELRLLLLRLLSLGRLSLLTLRLTLRRGLRLLLTLLPESRFGEGEGERSASLPFSRVSRGSLASLSDIVENSSSRKRTCRHTKVAAALNNLQ